MGGRGCGSDQGVVGVRSSTQIRGTNTAKAHGAHRCSRYVTAARKRVRGEASLQEGSCTPSLRALEEDSRLSGGTSTTAEKFGLGILRLTSHGARTRTALLGQFTAAALTGCVIYPPLWFCTLCPLPGLISRPACRIDFLVGAALLVAPPLPPNPRLA